MATPTIENSFVGDGSTVLYSFTFPYISSEDIKVTLDEVITTEYTFANVTTVEFDAAPADGVAIRIYRDTQITTIENVFYPGSAVRAKDLNDNFTQSLYVIQEADINVADANQNADDAVAAAEQAAADAASAAADASQSAADAAQAALDSASASIDAAAALVSADAAQVSATQAQIDATNALSSANTAVTSAAAAETSAADAQVSAADAQVSADAALVEAQDAEASAAAALALVTNFVGNGQPYQHLYDSSSGVAGSKVIDLGDLSSIGACSNAYFPGEDEATSDTYNMGLGCSSIDYGSVA